MRMNLTLRLLSILMVAILALPSCVSKKKFNQLMDEKTAMANSLAESQKQINNLEGQVNTLQSDMASQKTKFESDINGLRKDVDAAKMDADKARREAADKEAALAKIRKQITDSFGDAKVTNQNGDLVVTLADPVNYTSGSAKLNRQSRKSIEALATSLKNNPNMRIIVEGHADSDKYPGNGYNNWDLSVDRATAVVKRLIKLGVKPEQLSVAGRGDTAPVAPNDNRDNKAKNRRTEVKPNVKEGDIYDAVKN